MQSDSTGCLRKDTNGEWDTWRCSEGKTHCDGWEKDMKRCCPTTCENTKPFTIDECRASSGSGVCIYPNSAQCTPEGNVMGYCCSTKLGLMSKIQEISK